MSESTLTPNTVWLKVYTPGGFQASVTLTFTDAIPTAADVERRLIAAGYSATLPGLEIGQEKEAIATVMRRQSSDDTTIIDFYPAWSHRGKFGIQKYGHLYLNEPSDVAEFEARSGLKVTDLPLYDSDKALKRTYGKRHACEVTVRRHFEMTRTPDGQHESGMPKYKYAYFGASPVVVTAAAPTPAPAPVAPTESVNPFLAAKDQVIEALKASGLYENGRYKYMLESVVPGRKLASPADAYPDLTVDQFIARLPAIAAELNRPAQPKGEVSTPVPDAPFPGNG
jgi:hypothetical protein